LINALKFQSEQGYIKATTATSSSGAGFTAVGRKTFLIREKLFGRNEGEKKL